MIIIFFIVPPKGVELVVINHVNPGKNNVNLGVISKQKKKIKINHFIAPQEKAPLLGK